MIILILSFHILFFSPKATIVTTIYYWYSLLFLISRCFIMLYVTSSIYEASLKPLELLRNFSTYNWNLDLQRLLDHASLKGIAFTGKRFFFITRPLILAVGVERVLRVRSIFLNRFISILILDGWNNYYVRARFVGSGDKGSRHDNRL